MKTKEEITKAINELIEEMNNSFLTREQEANYWSVIAELQDQRDAIEDREHEEMLKDALNAMRECRFHDWLRCHTEELSRAELTDVLIEYAYQLERFNPVCTIDGGTASQEIADNLRIAHR